MPNLERRHEMPAGERFWELPGTEVQRVMRRLCDFTPQVDNCTISSDLGERTLERRRRDDG